MVSECVPFALLQTRWIQCLCPCWILAVGSLQGSWPLWQRSLLMSSKHTCSCHPKSTTGQARPLPLSTRWGESLLTCTTTSSVLIPLLKTQLCWVSCCLLKEVDKCQCFICSCSWTIQCQHFQDDEGGHAVVDQVCSAKCWFQIQNSYKIILCSLDIRREINLQVLIAGMGWRSSQSSPFPSCCQKGRSWQIHSVSILNSIPK